MTNTTSSGGGTLLWMAIWGIVGFAVYGSIDAALYLALVSFLVGITSIIGVIPVIGIFITMFLNGLIKTWLLTKITMTWVVGLMFFSSLAVSVIATFIVLIAIIAAVAGR